MPSCLTLNHEYGNAQFCVMPMLYASLSKGSPAAGFDCQP